MNDRSFINWLKYNLRNKKIVMSKQILLKSRPLGRLPENKLTHYQSIISGFDNFQNIIGLFEGKNTGKSLVEVS